MTLQSVQKVSKSGNALIVNIPQKIVDIMEIELGDYLTIDWGEVIKSKKKINNNKISKSKKLLNSSKTVKISKIQGKIIKDDEIEEELDNDRDVNKNEDEDLPEI